MDDACVCVHQKICDSTMNKLKYAGGCTWPPMGSRFQEISEAKADTTACEHKGLEQKDETESWLWSCEIGMEAKLQPVHLQLQMLGAT